MALDEIFMKEALALLDDNDIKLGVLARYKLKAYAEEYSRKIKDDPAKAKKILEKIRNAISNVLNQ